MKEREIIPKERAEEILRNFQRRKILVIGDVMLDRFLFGKAERISPEAPVPVVTIDQEKVHLGGAGNVAANISSLGGTPLIVGVVGNDLEGSRVRELLRSLKLPDDGLLVDKERITTVKTRIIAHNQQVVRTDWEKKTPLSPTMEKAIVSLLSDVLNNVDAVIVSDYAKGMITPKIMSYILTEGRKRDLFVAVDPKIKNKELYRGADIITPNVNEASALSDIEIGNEEELIRAGRRILRQFRLRALVITRGERGISLFLRDEDSAVHIPAEAREVYDVTGAGDTVIASFTLSKASSASWQEAAIIANSAAGVVVGKLGTATVSIDELEESLGISGELFL